MPGRGAPTLRVARHGGLCCVCRRPFARFDVVAHDRVTRDVMHPDCVPGYRWRVRGDPPPQPAATVGGSDR